MNKEGKWITTFSFSSYFPIRYYFQLFCNKINIFKLSSTDKQIARKDVLTDTKHQMLLSSLTQSTIHSRNCRNLPNSHDHCLTKITSKMIWWRKMKRNKISKQSVTRCFIGFFEWDISFFNSFSLTLGAISFYIAYKCWTVIYACSK